MPAKKESAHDCKAECAELHKQLASLRKEVALLKKQLASASKGGGKDPRVDKLIEYIKTRFDESKNGPEKRKKIKEIFLSL